MADAREIEALKASFRGVLSSAAALGLHKDRVSAMSAEADPQPAELADLLKVVAAHATASAALRGLLVTMLDRRGVGPGAQGREPGGGE